MNLLIRTLQNCVWLFPPVIVLLHMVCGHSWYFQKAKEKFHLVKCLPSNNDHNHILLNMHYQSNHHNHHHHVPCQMGLLSWFSADPIPRSSGSIMFMRFLYATIIDQPASFLLFYLCLFHQWIFTAAKMFSNVSYYMTITEMQ